MATFMIRIELQEAKSSDYDKLHEEMDNRNFIRKITTGKITHNAPTGTYFIENVDSINNVADMAISGAKATKKEFILVISKSEEDMLSFISSGYKE